MKVPRLVDVARVAVFGACLWISLCRFWMPWPEFGFRDHGGVGLGELNKFNLGLVRAICNTCPCLGLLEIVPCWCWEDSEEKCTNQRGLGRGAARAAHAPHPGFHALQWWGTFSAPRGQELHHQQPVAVRFDSSRPPTQPATLTSLLSFFFWGTGRLAVVHLLPTASTLI